MTTVSEELDLNSGAVSKAILQAAGPSMQDECRQKIKGKLSGGEFIETGPHKLQCKKVYHGYCLRWDGGRGSSDTVGVMLSTTDVLIVTLLDAM